MSFGSSSYSVEEGSSITVTVELSHRSSHVIRVPIKMSGGTDQRVAFTNRSTSGTFTINAKDDDDCDDETVNLSFGTLPSTVSRTPSPSGATVTIRDNDVCASFGSDTYTVSEGSGTDITVNLSRASSQNLEIPITVSAGRAESGDYVVRGLTDGKLSISAGKQSANFTIVANQEPDRDDETVNLQIGDPPPGVAEGTQASAIVTILDDEDVSVSFEHPSYTVNEEESVGVKVQLNGRRSQKLEIPITVSNGTAEDDDYDVDDLEDGILLLIFSAWHNSERFWIGADDDLDRDDETVNLGFGDLPSGVRRGSTPRATVTIKEPNVPPSFKEGPRTIRSVAENTVRNTDIGSRVEASDANGDTLTYSLTGTDSDAFTIGAISGQIRTYAPLDFETKNRYSVVVKVNDGRGGTDSIDITINVTDVDEPPDTPSAPTVTSNGTTSLNVTWSAPANTGPPINDYDVRYRAGNSGPFTDASHTGTARQTTISNLDPGAAYEIQVRAKNAEGTSDWSVSGTGSTDALPTITIEAEHESVIEGAPVKFILTADPAPVANLIVKVSVGETGLFLSGAPPSQIRIAAGSTTGEIVLQTMDDSIDEPNGDIDATILPGTGYSVGNPPSATVTVEDNDDPPLPTITIERHPETNSVIDEGDGAEFRLEAAPAPTADLAVLVSITETGSFIRPGESLARTITIRTGETTADFTVQTVDDDEDEHNGDITVEVRRDDTKYALGNPFVAVVRVSDDDQPDPPAELRANGNLDSDGDVTLRWKPIQGASGYGVRYTEERCDSRGICDTYRSWRTPTEEDLTITDQTISGESVKQANLGGLSEDTLYRIQVRSTIVSDSFWSHDDFALVFPTDSPLGDRTVATAPFHGHQPENVRGSHEFRYVTCTGTVSTELETPDRNAAAIARDIENAIEKWESTVVWESGGNNIVTATSYRPAGGENCTHPLIPIPFFNFLAEIPSGDDRFEVKFVSDERIEAACDPTDDRETPIPGCWLSASWLSPGIDQITKGTILINESLGGAHWNAQIAGADSCTRLHELVIHEAGHAFGIGKTVAEVIPRIKFDFNRHPFNTEHSVMSYEDPHRDCEPQAYDIVALMALYQSR